MNIQKKRYVTAGIIAMGIVWAIYGKARGVGWVVGFGVVMIVVGIVADYLALRCPFCKGYLGKYYSPGDFCPKCGEKVE